MGRDDRGVEGGREGGRVVTSAADEVVPAQPTVGAHTPASSEASPVRVVP